MIDIHERVSMNSPEASIRKALLQYLEGLSGKVFPLGCDDPHELTLCLECVNFIRAEQEIFAAEPSHDPLCALGRRRFPDFLELCHSFKCLTPAKPFCPFHRLG